PSFLFSFSPLLSSHLSSGHHRHLHSFPTRRSSDLRKGLLSTQQQLVRPLKVMESNKHEHPDLDYRSLTRIGWLSLSPHLVTAYQDRKSTRLNSSHVKISYAVFCLKKKKMTSSNVKN